MRKLIVKNFSARGICGLNAVASFFTFQRLPLPASLCNSPASIPRALFVSSRELQVAINSFNPVGFFKKASAPAAKASSCLRLPVNRMIGMRRR